MITSVVGVSLDPERSGVAKFNQQLAVRLGVPHRSWLQPDGTVGTSPLMSVKRTDLTDALMFWLQGRAGKFSMLWHDEGSQAVSRWAQQVWFASELGCPSLIVGDETRPGQTVLTYGMAHKAQEQHFSTLKALLDADGMPYTVCASAASHERFSEGSLALHAVTLRDIFGAHLRLLGYLADDALAKEIRDAHFVALFYAPAARANNTTLWAAMQAGTPVITNLDDHSPPELQHGKSVFDLKLLTELPDAPQRREVRMGGWRAAQVYSWDRVLTALRGVHASTHA